MIPIVLASASPRRRALLEALGLQVEVRPSHAAETTTGSPETVVTENARLKRDEIADGLSEPALVIAADTIVVVDDDILGKPADFDEARAMLQRLSGRGHIVYTGIGVRDTGTDQTAEALERTNVYFRVLSEAEIEVFIDAVKPLDRAGAYTVDGPGSLLVERYEGCYQNVLGLPMVRLETLLKTVGHSLFERVDCANATFL